MLRLRNPKGGQISLWESVLPGELFQLNEELQTVDRLLDDERLMAPFMERFHTRVGRPTIPIEVYLRLMYLKYRYGLGYETLVKEVGDSFMWRTFCRLSLDDRVPDPSTLIKLRKRFGEGIIEELNRLLLKKVAEEKLLRSKKLRVDTTVVEADIAYPTDAGLLADGVRVLTRTVKKIKSMGSAARVEFHHRTRTIKKRLLEIGKILRRRTGKNREEVDKVTRKIIRVAGEVVSSARRVYRSLQGQVGKISDQEKLLRLGQRLKEQLGLVERVIAQARQVVSGNRHIPERLVSIFDPGARPIRKGKLKAPTEFGRKVVVGETGDCIITAYRVLEGNPSDSDLLVPTVEEHVAIVGRQPEAVAADRGCSSSPNEGALAQLGVKRISLPQRGRKSKERRAYERQPWFRRLQRWRAGGEATISLLKRKFGLRRSLYRGTPGTKQWVGLAIFSYNLRRLAQLA